MSVEVSGWEIQLPPIIRDLIQQTKEGAENKSPLEKREAKAKGASSIRKPNPPLLGARRKADWKIMRYCCTPHSRAGRNHLIPAHYMLHPAGGAGGPIHFGGSILPCRMRFLGLTMDHQRADLRCMQCIRHKSRGTCMDVDIFRGHSGVL